MKNSFKETVAAGNFGEQFIIRLLANSGISAVKNPSKDKAEMTLWDIEATVDGQVFTIEVKFDKYEKKSGNIALEYYNPRKGKASGILATNSDLWVFVLNDPISAWVCRTDDLVHHFHTEPCVRDIACGGDGNAAMKLYRRESLFEKMFFRFDSCKPSEVAPILKNLLDVFTYQ
jgi:hypothetical protein